MAESSGAGERKGSRRNANTFMDLREVGPARIAVRVRPEYADQVWKALKFWDPGIKRPKKSPVRCIVYSESNSGTLYLEGEFEFVELRTRGSLERVTARLGPFMRAATRTRPVKERFDN